MKKTLSIVSTILSALSVVMISGCLNSSGSKSSGNLDLSKGNPNITGYIGSLIIPDGSVSPQDIIFDPISEDLIVSGAGVESIERGQIWESAGYTTTFYNVPTVTTEEQSFLKGYGLAYDPFRKLLFVCSNPSDRLGTVHPTVVVFSRDSDNNFVWQSAMNFEAKDHEFCGRIHLLNGYLFVTNKYADDNTYAALYSVNADANPLPANLDVSVKYSELEYAEGDVIKDKTLLVSLQRKSAQIAKKWRLLLLDQNKKQIISAELQEPTDPGPLVLSGSVKTMVLPSEVGTPKVFLNRDDELLFITDEKSIYSAIYHKDGGLVTSKEFFKLPANEDVTGMSFGEDRFGTTIYPVFFTTSQNLHGQNYVVKEFAFNPVTGES